MFVAELDRLSSHDALHVRQQTHDFDDRLQAKLRLGQKDRRKLVSMIVVQIRVVASDFAPPPGRRPDTGAASEGSARAGSRR